MDLDFLLFDPKKSIGHVSIGSSIVSYAMVLPSFKVLAEVLSVRLWSYLPARYWQKYGRLSYSSRFRQSIGRSMVGNAKVLPSKALEAARSVRLWSNLPAKYWQKYGRLGYGPT